ncbi:MAG TPA: glycoside hydrolase family 15 protein [Solirubrobacteraceae bacterium]|jgi:GH15 family glucan-1,4-alpha-glucosidase
MSVPGWLNMPHTLREYALLADGERGAVVGPRGDLVWMCFPHWDSEPLFSALIGGGGTYAVTPTERHVWGGYYEPRSLIWRSRWATNDALVECRQALALPSDPSRVTILCRVMAQRGSSRVLVVLNPLASFGRHGMRDLVCDEGGVWRARVEGLHLSWRGGEGARVVRQGPHHALELDLELSEGEHHDLVLVVSEQGDEGSPPDPDVAWRHTEQAWLERVGDFADTVAPRDAAHACAVMRGLSSSSGGMVAAATTSLPERAEEGRNYDYRYVWIRDQCYAGEAAARAGAFELLDDSVRFVTERLAQDGSDLRPAYTSRGTPIPDQQELDLEGYPGGYAVVGNRVERQFQLDVFGESLLLFAASADHDHLDGDGWRAAELAAGAIADLWGRPDAGIWELDPPREWTHSRLICAAGLRAISRHAPGERESSGWLALADAIVADTSRRALHPSGRWQRAPDDPRLDAALLLAGLRGAVPGDDPRSIATCAAVELELSDDLYCYRFRQDERKLGEAEGAFVLCGFWVALTLEQQGRSREAARWFERNRAACGPPGLLSEEFDVTQRQLRGNLPQAFAHALLLECAATLAGD